MKIFVSKIYTVAQYGFRRLDEEKTFNSYGQAFQFLSQEFFEEECNESFLKNYCAEIIEYELHNYEIITSNTLFNCLGEIIFTSKRSEHKKSIQKNSDRNFKPSFKRGDIVVIKYQIESSFSLFADTIGVVTGVPLEFDKWKEKHNLSPDFWEPNYMVEFIGDTGFLTHCHPFEAEMQLYDKQLPSALIVLDKIAEHFKKNKLIDEDILQSMRKGNIYLLNHKTINDINWD